MTLTQGEEHIQTEPETDQGSGLNLFRRLEQRYQLNHLADLITPSILGWDSMRSTLNGPFSLRVAVKEEFYDDGFFQIRVDLQAREQTLELEFFSHLGQAVESAFFERLNQTFPDTEVSNLKGYLIATTVYFNRMAIC